MQVLEMFLAVTRRMKCLPAKLKTAIEHMFPRVQQMSQPPLSPLKIWINPSMASSSLKTQGFCQIKVKVSRNIVPIAHEVRFWIKKNENTT